jgi:hypothetical protein
LERTCAATPSTLGSGERHDSLDAPARVPGASASSSSVIAAERGAPIEEAARVHVDGRRQRLGTRPDYVNVVCLPEQQVDCLECQLVTEAGGRIDRDESTVVAADEDVAGGQVAVEEDLFASTESSDLFRCERAEMT